MKKKFFRYSTITVLALFLLIAGVYSYSTFYNTKNDTDYLTPIPWETVSAYHVDYPIDSKLDAVIAARRQLGSSRLRSEEIPKVIYVERLRYGKAQAKALPKIGSSNNSYPLNKMVWVVVFEGQWHIEGGPIPRPTPTLDSFSPTLKQQTPTLLITPTIGPNRCVYVLLAGSESIEGGLVNGIYDCERWKDLPFYSSRAKISTYMLYPF